MPTRGNEIIKLALSCERCAFVSFSSVNCTQTRCRLHKKWMQEEYTYIIRIDQPRFKSVERCSFFIILECYHFQNLPAKTAPFLV